MKSTNGSIAASQAPVAADQDADRQRERGRDQEADDDAVDADRRRRRRAGPLRQSSPSRLSTCPGRGQEERPHQPGRGDARPEQAERREDQRGDGDEARAVDAAAEREEPRPARVAARSLGGGIHEAAVDRLGEVDILRSGCRPCAPRPSPPARPCSVKSPASSVLFSASE